MPAGAIATGASMDTRKAFTVDIIAGAIAPQQQKVRSHQLAAHRNAWQLFAAADASAVLHRLLMQITLERMTAVPQQRSLTIQVPACYKSALQSQQMVSCKCGCQTVLTFPRDASIRCGSAFDLSWQQQRDACSTQRTCSIVCLPCLATAKPGAYPGDPHQEFARQSWQISAEAPYSSCWCSFAAPCCMCACTL